MILFGVRSPLVVDYEETLRRLDVAPVIGVALDETVRMIDRAAARSLGDISAAPPALPFVACAFNPQRRIELAGIATGLGLEPAEALVDPTAVVAGSTRIGRLSYVNAAAVIGGASFLGENVLVNRSASIGHHCLIADGVSIGPGVTLAGNIRIGEGAIIGTGATILPDVAIGRGAVVAGGSLVRRNVPEAGFVAGHPAVARRFDPRRSVLGSHAQE